MQKLSLEGGIRVYQTFRLGTAFQKGVEMAVSTSICLFHDKSPALGVAVTLDQQAGEDRARASWARRIRGRVLWVMLSVELYLGLQNGTKGKV